MSDQGDYESDARDMQRDDDEWRTDVARSAWSAGINAIRDKEREARLTDGFLEPDETRIQTTGATGTYARAAARVERPGQKQTRSPSMDSIGAAFAWCMQQPGKYLAVSVVRSAGRWYATLTTEGQ